LSLSRVMDMQKNNGFGPHKERTNQTPY